MSKDFIAWLRTMGVPEQYAKKTAAFAYYQAHSGGYNEVVSFAVDLVGIFK